MSCPKWEVGDNDFFVVKSPWATSTSDVLACSATLGSSCAHARRGSQCKDGTGMTFSLHKDGAALRQIAS